MNGSETALKIHFKQLEQFLGNFNDYLHLAKTAYRKLVNEAIKAQKKAATFKTAVGAAVQTKDHQIFSGANIENTTRMCDTHAEINAVNQALLAGYRNADFEAIVIIYNIKNPELEHAFPACGQCRQYLQENCNENILVITAQEDGYITFAGPLKILYPLAYPSKIYERIKIGH